MAALTNKPSTSSQLVAATGLTKAQVRYWTKRLMAEGRILQHDADGRTHRYAVVQ
jgi:DNA-binding IclR family transcriptional regulator